MAQQPSTLRAPTAPPAPRIHATVDEEEPFDRSTVVTVDDTPPTVRPVERRRRRCPSQANTAASESAALAPATSAAMAAASNAGASSCEAANALVVAEDERPGAETNVCVAARGECDCHCRRPYQAPERVQHTTRVVARTCLGDRCGEAERELLSDGEIVWTRPPRPEALVRVDVASTRPGGAMSMLLAAVAGGPLAFVEVAVAGGAGTVTADDLPARRSAPPVEGSRDTHLFMGSPSVALHIVGRPGDRSWQLGFAPRIYVPVRAGVYQGGEAVAAESLAMVRAGYDLQRYAAGYMPLTVSHYLTVARPWGFARLEADMACLLPILDRFDAGDDVQPLSQVAIEGGLRGGQADFFLHASLRLQGVYAWTGKSLRSFAVAGDGADDQGEWWLHAVGPTLGVDAEVIAVEVGALLPVESFFGETVGHQVTVSATASRRF